MKDGGTEDKEDDAEAQEIMTSTDSVEIQNKEIKIKMNEIRMAIKKMRVNFKV